MGPSNCVLFPMSNDVFPVTATGNILFEVSTHLVAKAWSKNCFPYCLSMMTLKKRKRFVIFKDLQTYVLLIFMKLFGIS